MRRFSDTSRFDEDWYCSLPLEMKAAWELLWAKADSAGVWRVNHRLAEFQIGKKVDWLEFLKRTGKRIIQLDETRYLFVQFVKVNCGSLSRDCKAHNHVFVALESNGLNPEDAQSGSYSDSYLGSYSNATIQEEDKDKEGDKDIREGMQGEGRLPSDSEMFMAAWNELPTPPFTPIRSVTSGRLGHLKTRLREEFWVANWKSAIDLLRTLEFCQGKNSKQWTLDADYFLKPDTVAKIVEGKYKDRIQKTNGALEGESFLHLIPEEDR